MADLKIQIVWSENQLLHDLSIELQKELAMEFNTFEEFDAVLLEASTQSVVSPGCYDKTKFLVTYRTDTYKGRIDLKPAGCRQETSTGEISLAQHMKDNLNYTLSGKTKFSTEIIEGAKEWLNYLQEIEQITQEGVNSK